MCPGAAGWHIAKGPLTRSDICDFSLAHAFDLSFGGVQTPSVQAGCGEADSCLTVLIKDWGIIITDAK